MSSREMEDRIEEENTAAVARALGISIDDLDELDWKLEPHTSNDGLLYGYNVYFSEGSNAEILAKIEGLNGGRWVRIGPLGGDNE